MFKVFSRKNVEAKKDTQAAEISSKRISLITILDIIKNGKEIGLDIINKDFDGARDRMLNLENGVSIELTEWCEWHIYIRLTDNNGKCLVVYESPDLKIDWYDNEIAWNRYTGKPLEVEWSEEGPWCNFIESKIEEIKSKLDVYRKDKIEKLEMDKKEELARQIKEVEQLKNHFSREFKYN